MIPNDPSMPAQPSGTPVPAVNPQQAQQAQQALAGAQSQGYMQVQPATAGAPQPAAPQPLQAPTDRAHAIARAVEQAWAQRIQHGLSGQNYGNILAAFLLQELQKIGPGLIQDVIQAIEGALGGAAAPQAQRPPGQV